ncbi:hypothetical protein AB205_0067230 [Aquarana catesbeiana]|uniref:Uncharacterized protein n=1 Tax=Aquarana catesbeiana TaxID=8400 RepID=A0A2G9SE05_AQUCT|nr:hypothetical protein AB205_0067230 [Aquarana catesbeiana]
MCQKYPICPPIMSQSQYKSQIAAITSKKIIIKWHKSIPYFVDALTFAQTSQYMLLGIFITKNIAKIKTAEVIKYHQKKALFVS